MRAQRGSSRPAPGPGSRAGALAKRVWDVTLAGDLDPVPLARALRAGAAAGDAELQQLLDTVEQERLVGTASSAAHLSAVGALRPGLDVERAGHRLWVINAGETGDGLVLRCGWSLDEYQAWMTEMMVSALLQPPAETLDT